MRSTWNGGFVAGVRVTAGSAISGWKVTLTLPSGTSVANAWNGVATGTTGTVTVTNAGYNGALAAGQGTELRIPGQRIRHRHQHELHPGLNLAEGAR